MFSVRRSFLRAPNIDSAVKPVAIKKILVANRGEIACRVFKTASQMGIRTVAVYCDAEPNSKHVQHADEAYRIGPPPASTSYLQGQTIIEVAKRCNADAIHPGYGFLSENAEFANLCKVNGVEFMGPPASAIVSMGSKSESKIIMTKADVPVVPGYHGEDQSTEVLTAEAKKVGLPLLIKAVSGGGGKGMKIVRSMEDFPMLLASAQREAVNFFKDPRVLLERYIENPRHIEVQVFCDKHGNGVYFFERDCSVQRRHQKVLEEAPAPNISEDLRKRLGRVAVAAAKAVNYVGAGTVEFIFDTSNGDFFFMEMNTRLQVEHPVTEEVCLVKGKPLDLVRLMVDTAAGKPFGFTQEDLALNGHCIEARVFAESPRSEFLPGSGKLSFVAEPKQGETALGNKVRVDTGFRSGDEVLVHYDPMIAKLIVWGKDRDSALAGLRTALDEYHVVGIPTNIDFCKACLENDAFKAGGVTTKFIDQHKETLLKHPYIAPEVFALAAVEFFRASAAAIHGGGNKNNNNNNSTSSISSNNNDDAASTTKCVIKDCAPFRLYSNCASEVVFYRADMDAKTASIAYHVESVGKDKYNVSWMMPASASAAAEGTNTDAANQKLVRFSVTRCPALRTDQNATACRVADLDAKQPAEHRLEYSAVDNTRDDSRTLAVRFFDERGCISFQLPAVPRKFGHFAAGGLGGAEILSPMPGKFSKMIVPDGAAVEEGDAVLIVEAMKMEHVVKADVAGVIKYVAGAREGQMCGKDQHLATVVEPKTK